MRLSVLKELQAKWIVSTYDYLSANPQIGINGFKEAGIVAVIEDPSSIETRIPLDKVEEDPFADVESEDD